MHRHKEWTTTLGRKVFAAKMATKATRQNQPGYAKYAGLLGWPTMCFFLATWYINAPWEH